MQYDVHVLGAKQRNAVATTFFLTTCAKINLLALFGDKPFKANIDAFSDCHNNSFMQPKSALKTTNQSNKLVYTS